MALVSPSGLCRECASTEETGAPTFAPPIPPLDPPTESFRVSSGAFAPTASQLLPTVLSGRPLPTAPAGYELLDRLGGGGMGEVYLARETASERLVAMKFLRYPGDPTAFDRFAEELRILAKLDHPNIVRLFATDFLRADPYFTMEYVPGGSLARVDGPLPLEAAVELVRAVAGAVGFAHAASVIHRDLKPSNILFGADGAPKVADFGLAKRLDATDPLTIMSGGLGTPGYMPPEQVSRRNGNVGPWSDVYGLGATLYHLLTGRAPFIGDTPADTISKVLADPPERIRAQRPDAPMALEAIILKCLEKDPKDRYQTVADLVADLDRYEADEGSVVAPLLTRRRRAARWLKRNSRGVLTSAVAILLLAGAAALGAAYRSKPESGSHGAEVSAEALENARRDLKAGKKVTLIPAKGMPAWYDRPISGVEVGTDISVEGACTVNSVRNGSLVLMPDVPIDRYSVEGEFCELAMSGAPRNNWQWIGLTVGYNISPTPRGRMHSFFTAHFSDYDVAGSIGQFGQPEHVICGAGAIVEVAGRNAEPVVGNGLYRAAYTPSRAHPGQWRKVKLDVEPAGIRASWRNDAGEMVPFADLGAEQIRERIDNIQNGMNTRQPPLGGPIPNWSPRNGIALWCAQSAFGVRNVVVTPTP